jgi:hypothetical protein
LTATAAYTKNLTVPENLDEIKFAVLEAGGKMTFIKN